MTTGLRRLTGASLIMGDFNDILQADDKLNGIIVKDNEVVKFVDFEHTNCLSEMKIVGRKYKWANGHVLRRFARILVNGDLLLHWPNIEGIAMDPWLSDHSSLKVKILLNTIRKFRQFKFYNYTVDYSNFKVIMEE